MPKNVLVVMPDAALNETVSNVINSAFGSAGQRCLAGSVVVTVGEGHDRVRDAIVEAAGSLTVGNGADDGVDLGPVISHTAKERILGCIERGVDEGAALLLDGRGAAAEQNENGAFVGATIFDRVQPDMTLFTDEIFGPVLSMLHVDTLDDAITLIENQRYGKRCFHLYAGRRGSPRVPLPRPHRQHRHQRGRGRTHGLLPLQRR